MKLISIIILIGITIISCSPNMELGELYKQPIKNTSEVIYYFRLLGGFATSSDYTGYVIIDSTDIFSINEIRKNELRGGFIEFIQGNNIRMNKMTWDENYNKDNDSIGYFTDKFGKIEVKTVEYNSGWSLGNQYFINEIKDDENSITFIGLKKKFGKDLPDSVTFEKGGMFVYENNGYLSRIDFSKIMKRKKGNGMIEYGTEMFQFYLKDSIPISMLSDYGYFKRVK